MNKSAKSYLFLFLFLLIGLMTSCKRQSLGIFASKSEKEKYLEQLTSAGIDKTVMGRTWLIAGSEALVNPPLLDIPTAVRGSFKSRSIQANAWQLDMQKGATLQIGFRWESQDSSLVFLEILNAQSMQEEIVATSLDELIEFEAEETGFYIIRIQPELSAEGTFDLTVENRRTYSVFPVKGKTSASIQSFWGAVRDGGARRHEGIDIFADRGTPVTAPVAGVVSSVKESGIGGKQVWLRDTKRGWNLYFAHLDSQTVSPLQRVNPGDTLGLVGNTGNAKFTPPHLHFGIYGGGAFDPLPVVKDNFPKAKAGSLPVENEVLLVQSPSVNLRQGPSTAHPSLLKLEKETPVTVQSAVGEWYQVKTPTGISGFLYSNLLIVPSESAVGEGQVFAFRDPFASPSDSVLVSLGEFGRIGSFLEFDLIRDGDDNYFYILKSLKNQ